MSIPMSLMRACAHERHAWDALWHGASMRSLLSSSIGAASRPFPISRFRTQHLIHYYILHRDCILYLYVNYT